jgi:general secretion pathway protein H
MAPMDKKVEPVQQRISSAGPNDSRTGEQGFTLLEVVCALAILAIIAALIPSALSHSTSRPRLEAYAVAMAGLLKADRNAALRRSVPIATEVDAKSRLIRSGATGRVVRVPDDVTFDALLSGSCNKQSAGSAIRFFPSGMSCGGVIALTRLDYGYEIRVNWLTGEVEIVSRKST